MAQLQNLPINEILDLKLYIEGLLPETLVVISCPTARKAVKLCLICVRNLLIHMFLLF